ncbi:MAG: hypothetical protein M1281_18035 [Chloroflexi bacterium]|nr:hypothetical protein [Chloroflexota bacterium]
MAENVLSTVERRKLLPVRGWLGLALVAVFWPLNWLLSGPRTLWAFFPLWLGYCLVIDAVSYRIYGTSLFSRSWKRYVGLFLVSAPGWWIFEFINFRIQNWQYLGANPLGGPLDEILATLNFSVVIPAIFGAAELFSGGVIRKIKPGLPLKPTRRTTWGFFIGGWVMLALLIAWPQRFFAFAWLSVFFILEPVNVWLKNTSLARWTQRGDWRPVLSLFAGALFTGFFWEMWNYLSFPKWIYTVPGVNFWHIFEMPLLGYFGYLPFALELFALYHLIAGLLKRDRKDYPLLDRDER